MLIVIDDHNKDGQLNSTCNIHNNIIHFCRPSLQSLHSDSSQLSEAIGRASNLAESVSSKVRILDLAKVGMQSSLISVTLSVVPLLQWISNNS